MAPHARRRTIGARTRCTASWQTTTIKAIDASGRRLSTSLAPPAALLPLTCTIRADTSRRVGAVASQLVEPPSDPPQLGVELSRTPLQIAAFLLGVISVERPGSAGVAPTHPDRQAGRVIAVPPAAATEAEDLTVSGSAA
jgi:hypothetical protein